MKRFFTLALTATTLLLAQACKKDQPTPQPSTEQLLSANTWHLTALKADPALLTNTGQSVTNLFPYIDDCVTNNTQQFLAGGVFKADEGPTKCDPQDPQTITGTWAVNASGNDKGLLVTADNNQVQFKILSLTSSELQVSTTDDVFGLGVATTLTLTYTKK